MSESSANVGKMTGHTAEELSGRSFEIKIAIIGAAAALLGAVVGGTSTYAVTTHSENIKRTEDRRTERRDAYTRYYGDAASFVLQFQLKLDELLTAESQTPPDLPAVQRISADFNERTRQLGQDQAQVVLLGSKGVSDASSKLIHAFYNLETKATKDKSSRAALQNSLNSATTGMDAFSAAARKDLGY